MDHILALFETSYIGNIKKICSSNISAAMDQLQVSFNASCRDILKKLDSDQDEGDI